MSRLRLEAGRRRRLRRVAPALQACELALPPSGQASSRSEFRQGSGSAALATPTSRAAPTGSRKTRPRFRIAHWSRALARSATAGQAASHWPAASGSKLFEVDAVGTKGGGVFRVGLRLVVVDAQVVVDGSEPLDDPWRSFSAPSAASTLAAEIRQELLGPAREVLRSPRCLREATRRVGRLQSPPPRVRRRLQPIRELCHASLRPQKGLHRPRPEPLAHDPDARDSPNSIRPRPIRPLVSTVAL